MNSLFIATPLCDGRCFGLYAQSLCGLVARLTESKVPYQIRFTLNQSSIVVARNYLAHDFMQTDARSFLCIDADVAFNPGDAMKLLELQSFNERYSIIGGAYPYKNPDELRFSHTPLREDEKLTFNKPVEVRCIGTGFMMVSRDYFERLNEEAVDFVDSNGENIKYFFDEALSETLVKESRQQELLPWRNDYRFCARARHLGFNVWLCPWMELQQLGTHVAMRDNARYG